MHVLSFFYFLKQEENEAFPAGSYLVLCTLFLASLLFPVFTVLLVKHKKMLRTTTSGQRFGETDLELTREPLLFVIRPHTHTHTHTHKRYQGTLIPECDNRITVLKSIAITIPLPGPSATV